MDFCPRLEPPLQTKKKKEMNTLMDLPERKPYMREQKEATKKGRKFKKQRLELHPVKYFRDIEGHDKSFTKILERGVHRQTTRNRSPVDLAL